MKRILLLGLLCSLFFFPSCDEIGPSVNLGGGGTGGSGNGEQERMVLIEEFTGVKCKNCPQGSELIEDLVDTYGKQLIPISIHSGFFAEPYTNGSYISNYDFRTPEGTAIETALGTASAFPAASVNRTLFDGAGGLIVEKNTWAGYIAQELAIPPAVEINLSKNYNGNSRLLEITADFSFVETISEPLNISVIVTEDGIVDAQKMPDDTVNPNYVHKHVFRGMMTAAAGDAYSSSTTNAGDSGSSTFTMTLPNNWVASNCHIIVLAHSGSNNEVFQANSIGLQD